MHLWIVLSEIVRDIHFLYIDVFSILESNSNMWDNQAKRVYGLKSGNEKMPNISENCKYISRSNLSDGIDKIEFQMYSEYVKLC